MTSEPRLERSEDMKEWYFYYLWPNCIHILDFGTDSNLHDSLNVPFFLFFLQCNWGATFHHSLSQVLKTVQLAGCLMLSVTVLLVTYFSKLCMLF